MDELNINISRFLDTCELQLLRTVPTPISYIDKLALKNNNLPDTLGSSPLNVYALWEKKPGAAGWTPVYIGQRTSLYGWSRIKEHLFHVYPGTQSKLHRVKVAIESGSEIGITSILVMPDSMRLTVEDELIFRCTTADTDLLWNNKARNMELPGRSKGKKKEQEAKQLRLKLIKQHGREAEVVDVPLL